MLAAMAFWPEASTSVGTERCVMQSQSKKPEPSDAREAGLRADSDGRSRVPPA